MQCVDYGTFESQAQARHQTFKVPEHLSAEGPASYSESSSSLSSWLSHS
jgi:hypothetical protein